MKIRDKIDKHTEEDKDGTRTNNKNESQWSIKKIFN